MALANGGYLHCMDIRKFLKILLKATKKFGHCPLKNSGERSRVTLVLLFIGLKYCRYQIVSVFNDKNFLFTGQTHF